MHEVHVGAELAAEVTRRWGPERTGAGRSSEYDFWSGPITNARLAFRAFDTLPYDVVPEIRHLHLVDPVFGIVVFFGVLVGPDEVEFAAFADDPDYWQMVENDPDD